MVIVSGTIFFADQAARDGAVAASIDLQRATRTDEPGCLAYVFTADPAEPVFPVRTPATPTRLTSTAAFLPA